MYTFFCCRYDGCISGLPDIERLVFIVVNVSSIAFNKIRGAEEVKVKLDNNNIADEGDRLK